MMTPAAAVVLIFCMSEPEGIPTAWEEPMIERSCASINAEVDASTVQDCETETEKLTAPFLEAHPRARLMGRFCTLKGER